MNYKEFKQYVDKTNKSIADKLKDSEEELAFYAKLVKRFNDICDENQQLKERIAYLERSIERKDDTIIELRNDNCYCNRTDCSSRIRDSKKI